jgi:hypothetical protein
MLWRTTTRIIKVLSWPYEDAAALGFREAVVTSPNSMTKKKGQQSGVDDEK